MIENLYDTIHLSDNLEFLKTLPVNCIDFIYSDILYGTGRDFGEYVDLPADINVIYEHYVPRIKHMHRVLNANGVIYLQMDTRINHWLRMIMDDVFGYNNFQNEISWCYNSQGKTKERWNKKHDVILFYSKSKSYKFYPERIMDSITDLTYKRFKSEIDKKGYYTSYKNGKEYKYYLENGSLPKDWFEDITYLSQENREVVGYPTQKPKELIKRLMLSTTNVGDVVADFYMGSGTTVEVAMELQRKYIACDINLTAFEKTNKRIKNFTNNKNTQTSLF